MTEQRHIDTSDATRLWRHIFSDSRGLLHIWTVKRYPTGETQSSTGVPRNFSYPDDIECAAKLALEKSELGCEGSFCVHLLTDQQRDVKNAAEIRSLWADLDGVEIPCGNLKPSAVVETSPGHYHCSSRGHYHCYWRLTNAIKPDVAEELNRKLMNKIGAHPDASCLTQLLRIPGTRNYKYYEQPPTAKVVEITDITYSPGELADLVG
jgi:hypothetical protein